MDIAVITGASSGIGKEFCLQLDNQGFDEVWAIALDQEGLDTLSTEMKTPVRTFAWDLTDEQSFAKYQELLAHDKPVINWLVNCSGFGKFGRYDEISVDASANMIDLNCKALMKMTEYSIPYMIYGSRIVEIASVAGFQPTPYLSVYGATKAFVLSYSRAMRVELKSKGISVTCVCPFWTKTNFFNRAKDTRAENEVITKYVVMYDAKKVVKKAVKDSIKRKGVSIYGFVARSQCRLVKLLPNSAIMGVWVGQQKFKKKYKNK